MAPIQYPHKKDYSILKEIGYLIVYSLPCYLIPLTIFALNGEFEPNPLNWPNLNEKFKAELNLEYSVNAYELRNIKND
ncbi:hypothetical protein J4455_05495 [Candidatus Woesearchaeota archaeon]|nr:hypothetical protein [Candidatus Woesearchaeota archaeon]